VLALMEDKHQLLSKLAQAAEEKALLIAEREELARGRMETERRLKELEVVALKSVSQETDQLMKTQKLPQERMLSQEHEQVGKVREHFSKLEISQETNANVHRSAANNAASDTRSQESIAKGGENAKLVVPEREKPDKGEVANKDPKKGRAKDTEASRERKKKRTTIHLVRKFDVEAQQKDDKKEKKKRGEKEGKEGRNKKEAKQGSSMGASDSNRSGSYVLLPSPKNTGQFTREDNTTGVHRSRSYDALTIKEAHQSLAKRAAAGNSVEQLKKLGQEMKKGLEVKTHKHNLKRYEKCFKGEHAVEWLVQVGHAGSRLEAEEICRRLLEAGTVFACLPGLESSGFIGDSRSVYQFL